MFGFSFFKKKTPPKPDEVVIAEPDSAKEGVFYILLVCQSKEDMTDAQMYLLSKENPRIEYRFYHGDSLLSTIPAVKLD